MPRKIDPVIAETLRRFDYGPDACWDCHGTWVVYHRVLEQIAAKAKITFAAPVIVEANTAAGCAAICVTGTMDATTEWSIGEASPKNNKTAYCWAMAEKRAKDRVILKLIGLHGLAYSEEEADEFKRPANNNAEPDNRALDENVIVTDLVGRINAAKSTRDLDLLIRDRGFAAPYKSLSNDGMERVNRAGGARRDILTNLIAAG